MSNANFNGGDIFGTSFNNLSKAVTYKKLTTTLKLITRSKVSYWEISVPFDNLIK